MNQKSPSATSHPSRGNSEAVSIELTLFACGHGDTLLIRLPGPRWVLVDCHLPRWNGTYDAFLELLRSKQVDRLDWVFLTHPHEDHFHGMRDLLEHYTKDGRTLGRWLVSGLSAHDVRAIAFRDARTRRRYRDLVAFVGQLAAQGLIRREFASDGSAATSPAGYQGKIDIYPIAPSAESQFRHAERALPKLRDNPATPIETNSLSIVLLFALREGDAVCNAVLTGDAGPGELPAMIERLRTIARERGTDCELDILKVPHHGSVASHGPEFVRERSRTREPAVAAISAGTRRGIPHRTVIRDYLEGQWRVVSTVHPSGAPAAPDIPLSLADRGPRERQVKSSSVTITWRAGSSVEFFPADAEVFEHHLKGFEVASDA